MNAKPSILYVAYPLLTVGEESCGGAEQILSTLEREMAARGYRTFVAASRGSRVSGTLVDTGAPSSSIDDYERREAEHIAALDDFLARHPVDLIHDHSGTFWMHTARHVAQPPSAVAPMLVTLHLPRTFYPPNAFRGAPANVSFNCVSHSQQHDFGDVTRCVVPNGILVNRFPPRDRKDDFLLWMGRICEEKGAHLAIEVAQRCRMRLVVAGEVYPFSYHQRYFEREVLPHLKSRDSLIHYLGPQALAAKVRLLRQARALLLTSQCPETSSVVAMEAMACGTPVLALRCGAIPEVIADGRTGYVVDDVDAMVAALPRVAEIDPAACVAHVRSNFTATRMAGDYECVYEQLLCQAAQTLAA